MKICIIQPQYPEHGAEPKVLQSILQSLDDCQAPVDLIMLPEYASTPGVDHDEDLKICTATATPILLAAVAATARRCQSLVCVNVALAENGKIRNTTLLYNRDGNKVAAYAKLHLTSAEINTMGLDNSYIAAITGPSLITVEGLRIGFLTCFDIYFGEYIEHLAAMAPDIILFPTYQRRETSEIVLMQSCLAAHKANAFVIRASYSMGEGSSLGGNSLIAAPDGRVLANMRQSAGMLTVEIDPHAKRTWPRNPGLNYQASRQPHAYLRAGTMISEKESAQAYPRICAHRGFNTAAPENTLPAFGAAIALGADEIEFDVRMTADHQLIVIHDRSIDRTTNKQGFVDQLSAGEIRQADAGSWFSPSYSGLQIPFLAEVLGAFAGQTIMNLHVYFESQNDQLNQRFLMQIVALIYRYNCQDYIYISGSEDVLKTSLAIAPELPRCCIAGQFDYTIVRKAIDYQCTKLQFFQPYLTRDMVIEAHAASIKCNLFWADEVQAARDFVKMGIDTILTNDYLKIKQALI